MGAIGSTSSATLSSKNTNTVIYNVECTNANTEYSQAFPSKCVGFILRSRQLSNVKISFSSGGTSTDYLTVLSGCSIEDLNYRQDQTIYFQSDVSGAIIELFVNYNT